MKVTASSLFLSSNSRMVLTTSLAKKVLLSFSRASPKPSICQIGMTDLQPKNRWPPVGVYRQACSGIPLAVRFVGRDRRLWNSMVQGTQRFRQVRAASCVIPYVLCGSLYFLRCSCVLRGSLSALIYPGGQGYMKSPSSLQLESYYNMIG